MLIFTQKLYCFFQIPNCFVSPTRQIQKKYLYLKPIDTYRIIVKPIILSISEVFPMAQVSMDVKNCDESVSNLLFNDIKDWKTWFLPNSLLDFILFEISAKFGIFLVCWILHSKKIDVQNIMHTIQVFRLPWP